jgi:hypothetical protein
MSQFAYTHIIVLVTVDIVPISKVLADENGICRRIQFFPPFKFAANLNPNKLLYVFQNTRNMFDFVSQIS